MRGTPRPGVTPAMNYNFKTVAEHIDDVRLTHTSNLKRTRKVIEDTCDFCFTPTWFDRDLFMHMKKEKWIFACWTCINERKLTVGKGSKVISPHRYNSLYKAKKQ